jgi:hypothetical protein
MPFYFFFKGLIKRLSGSAQIEFPKPTIFQQINQLFSAMPAMGHTELIPGKERTARMKTTVLWNCAMLVRCDTPG